jgi:hypothetical protein
MQYRQEFNGYSNNRQEQPLDGINDSETEQLTRRQAMDILSSDDASPILVERAQETLRHYEEQLPFGMVDESGLS